MDLGPEQYFIYAWRYADDTACKLGVGTLQTFYARIKAARTVTYQEIELLGIEVFETETEARRVYKGRLETFERVNGRRAWVVFDDVVREWLETACVSNPPRLEDFKDAFLSDPARRERERVYQQRASERRRAPRSARKKSEKQRERQKAWRAKNPAYDKNRYANDPEYAEAWKAARRKRYAENPEYREREKQRRKEWEQKNPDYKEKRRLYMQEYRKRKKEAAEEE